jgi:hypothetical protein
MLFSHPEALAEYIERSTGNTGLLPGLTAAFRFTHLD